ncbi:MAG: cytidylate kinase-like family protein [Desulfobacteraceae bacterium]|nr:cytidylate kinase-like family protein [Desulfobacteraceae bacterium]
MAIITISRGCFSHGKEVAEKTGEMLGYKVISRETLIEEAAQVYHVPEKELIQSVHAPSVLERFTRGKEQYLSYIQAMLLEHAVHDNLIYHGHASHMLLPDISHVLNVRILADIPDRIAFMQQSHAISDKEAMRHITAEDQQRARWADYLYKIDITDPNLYDIIIHIKNLNIGDACNIIYHTAQMDAFAATPESRQAIADLALRSRVTAAIESAVKLDMKYAVNANSGIVHIRTGTPSIRKTSYMNQNTQDYLREKIKQETRDEIAQAIKDIPGIKNVIYEIAPPDYT